MCAIAALPVPWAGLDRTSKGAFDIVVLSSGVDFGRSAAELCSSSDLAWDVTMAFAFSGRESSSKQPAPSVRQSAAAGAAAVKLWQRRPGERASGDGDSCPALAAICTDCQTTQGFRVQARAGPLVCASGYHAGFIRSSDNSRWADHGTPKTW